MASPSKLEPVKSSTTASCTVSTLRMSKHHHHHRRRRSYHHHHHHHSLSSVSSPSTSSSSASSASSYSPSEDNLMLMNSTDSPPSTPDLHPHHHHRRRPTSSSSSSDIKARVPFSWERLPGIPKTPTNTSSSSKSNLSGGLITGRSRSSSISNLPLPPSSSSSSSSVTSRKSSTSTTTTTTTRTPAIHPPTSNANSCQLIWRWDPFLAALLECSNDTSFSSSTATTKTNTAAVVGKLPRSISTANTTTNLSNNRLGFGMVNHRLLLLHRHFSCKPATTTTPCGGCVGEQVFADSIVQLPPPPPRYSTSYCETRSRRPSAAASKEIEYRRR